MSEPLGNLRALRNEMRQRHRVIACFPFVYKRRRYFVLPQLYVPPRDAPKYQLLELTFVDRDNLARTLTAPANSRTIDVGARQIREYFGIEYADNVRNLIEQFCERLGQAVPARLPADPTPEQRDVMVQHLDRIIGEDPAKRYCYAVRRNPRRDDGTPGQRSEYNSQKTELLRPSLYAYLRQDSNVSFCYSTDPGAELSDERILAKFAST